jgi:hypothetical protein
MPKLSDVDWKIVNIIYIIHVLQEGWIHAEYSCIYLEKRKKERLFTVRD